jgi:hypothetical protein
MQIVPETMEFLLKKRCKNNRGMGGEAKRITAGAGGERFDR